MLLLPGLALFLGVSLTVSLSFSFHLYVLKDGLIFQLFYDTLKMFDGHIRIPNNSRLLLELFLFQTGKRGLAT